MNYVNEQEFFAWYRSVTGCKEINAYALLDEVFRQYLKTGEEQYRLPPEKTLSGREETYPFTYEDRGCCGASTRFIKF